MTSARVVGLAVLLVPLCTFAQTSSAPAKVPEDKANRPMELAEVEPGILKSAVSGSILLPPIQMPDTDNVCYTMRTYVVARDSKDSDSVHPVRYSTCTPAGKRQVKKVTQSPAER
jgi:hypothetical protein